MAQNGRIQQGTGANGRSQPTRSQAAAKDRRHIARGRHTSYRTSSCEDHVYRSWDHNTQHTGISLGCARKSSHRHKLCIPICSEGRVDNASEACFSLQKRARGLHTNEWVTSYTGIQGARWTTVDSQGFSEKFSHLGARVPHAFGVLPKACGCIKTDPVRCSRTRSPGDEVSWRPWAESP